MDVRPVRSADLDVVVRLWHETKRVAYPFLPLEQTRTLDEDRAFFEREIAPRCDLWLAEEDGGILAFLALRGSYLDRLYVHPDHQRRGVGTRLLAEAKRLRPGGLELHTHQRNRSARRFYEKHDFHAVRFGVSPPPENEPDVEYHWRPRVSEAL